MINMIGKINPGYNPKKWIMKAGAVVSAVVLAAGGAGAVEDIYGHHYGNDSSVNGQYRNNPGQQNVDSNSQHGKDITGKPGSQEQHPGDFNDRHQGDHSKDQKPTGHTFDQKSGIHVESRISGSYFSLESRGGGIDFYSSGNPLWPGHSPFTQNQAKPCPVNNPRTAPQYSQLYSNIYPNINPPAYVAPVLNQPAWNTPVQGQSRVEKYLTVIENSHTLNDPSFFYQSGMNLIAQSACDPQNIDLIAQAYDNFLVAEMLDRQPNMISHLSTADRNNLPGTLNALSTRLQTLQSQTNRNDIIYPQDVYHPGANTFEFVINSGRDPGAIVWDRPPQPYNSYPQY